MAAYSQSIFYQVFSNSGVMIGFSTLVIRKRFHLIS